MFQPFRIKNGTWLQYCFVGSKLNEDLTILYQTANQFQLDVLFQRFWKFHPIRMNFPCRPCFSPNQKEMMNLFVYSLVPIDFVLSEKIWKRASMIQNNELPVATMYLPNQNERSNQCREHYKNHSCNIWSQLA